MPVFTDQLGRAISLQNSPKRIISIVPSQTELLYDLGLDEEIIGITKFCVHPEKWFRNKTRVGGTKQLNLKIIHALKPDLIIANKEENTKEQIDELEKHFPVWISDIKTLKDALAMISSVGEITGTQTAPKKIISQINKNFAELKPKTRKIKAAYFIWRNPYMVAGGDTFINEMMGYCRFENIFVNANRYPEINIEELLKKNCELLLLSSEPFPFKQKHIEELKNQLPGVKIVLVDGEMFSWYGSRLIHAPLYFNQLLAEMAK
ncbi:MAG TPA: helical backbone metal receptor [Puia sp.]|jgi:ABC-type Fe3+-hydroxamate transport system substrate-binding protein|nr:helical backbone metal receptor [Puia sp.]